VLRIMIAKPANSRHSIRSWTLRLLLLTLFFVHAQAQADRAEALFQQAQQAEQKGDSGKAAQLYQQLIRIAPERVEGHANLGVILAHAGDLGEAEKQYRIALRIAPDNSVIQTNMAILLYKEAHYDQAAGLLTAVLHSTPGQKQALLLLADCDLRLGRAQEVITLLDPVYAADPANRAVSYLLGQALIAVGNAARGAAVIDRVLRDGDTGYAQLLIGARLYDRGKSQLAAVELRKAVALSPQLAPAWSLLGRALLDEEDFSGARDAFHHALALDGNDFDANLYLGGSLRHDGQLDAALPYLQKAYRIRPDAAQTAYQLGALEAARGNLQEALKYLEPVAKKWPEFQQAHVQLASVYQRLNRLEDSRRERQTVIELDRKERQTQKRSGAATE